MILVYGRNAIGHVIHAVMGPESQAWSDLHGAMTIDITPLLKLCTEDAPVLLNISTCDNEIVTANRLQSVMARGAQYPFLPGTLVMTPASGRVNDDDDEVKQSAAGGRKNKTKKVVTVTLGRCSRCAHEEAELIPGLDPPVCFSCAKIDLYKARKENPHGNTSPTAEE